MNALDVATLTGLVTSFAFLVAYVRRLLSDHSAWFRVEGSLTGLFLSCALTALLVGIEFGSQI